jgi:hypothetical protein
MYHFYRIVSLLPAIKLYLFWDRRILWGESKNIVKSKEEKSVIRDTS